MHRALDVAFREDEYTSIMAQAMEMPEEAVKGCLSTNRAIEEGRMSCISDDTALSGSNDLFAVSGTETDGRATFAMPLDTGGEYDTALSPGSEIILIYAYGGDGQDNYTRKHVDRGGFRVQL